MLLVFLLSCNWSHSDLDQNVVRLVKFSENCTYKILLKPIYHLESCFLWTDRCAEDDSASISS